MKNLKQMEQSKHVCVVYGYWTRKVIPDALPHVSAGRVSVEDAVETAVNRKELKETTETAAQTVLKRNREESVQHVLLRSHPPEL